MLTKIDFIVKYHTFKQYLKYVKIYWRTYPQLNINFNWAIWKSTRYVVLHLGTLHAKAVMLNDLHMYLFRYYHEQSIINQALVKLKALHPQDTLNEFQLLDLGFVKSKVLDVWYLNTYRFTISYSREEWGVACETIRFTSDDDAFKDFNLSMWVAQTKVKDFIFMFNQYNQKLN